MFVPLCLTSSPRLGYVAGVIVKELLDAGLTVHCAVRDPNNAEKIQHLVDVAENSKGTIKFFQADLLEDGSYNEAMKGCSVVFHTASPLVGNVPPEKIDEVLFTPALDGTRNVLKSAEQTSSVKRVVLTSSCYAIATDAADCYDVPNQTVTEETWNTTASRTHNPYAYSKVLAEQEAWKIAKAQSSYQLVVVNPAWVFGPGLKTHPTSESYKFMKLLGDGAFKSGAPKMGCFVVDVRDVAQAHVAAAFTENAEGRYICCGHNTSIFEFASTLTTKFPDFDLPTSSPPKWLVWLLAPYIGLSRTQAWRGIDYIPTLDNSKSKTDLGMDYRPMDETFPDMFQQMIDENMIAAPSK